MSERQFVVFWQTSESCSVLAQIFSFSEITLKGQKSKLQKTRFLMRTITWTRCYSIFHFCSLDNFSKPMSNIFTRNTVICTYSLYLLFFTCYNLFDHVHSLFIDHYLILSTSHLPLVHYVPNIYLHFHP